MTMSKVERLVQKLLIHRLENNEDNDKDFRKEIFELKNYDDFLSGIQKEKN